MERDELFELLLLSFKSQGFSYYSSYRKVETISDNVPEHVISDKHALKSILERMGKALTEASIHVK